MEVLLQFLLIRDGQLLTAFPAAAGQNLAAVGSCHALTETVNGLAALAMRLECTFHAFCFFTFNNPENGVAVFSRGHHTPGFVKGTQR